MRRPRYLLVAFFFACLAMGSFSRAADSKDTCLMFAAQHLQRRRQILHLCSFSKQKVDLARGNALEYDVYLDGSDPKPHGGVDIDTDRANLATRTPSIRTSTAPHGDTELKEAAGQVVPPPDPAGGN